MANKLPNLPTRRVVRTRHPARFWVVSVLACSLVGIAPLPASRAAEPSALQAELDSAAAQYGRFETQLAETEQTRRRLEADLSRAGKTISERSALMKARANYFYKRGGVSTYLSELLMAENIGTFSKRLYYLEILGSQDSKLIDGLQVTQARADQIFEELAQAKARQSALVEQQRNKKDQLEVKLKSAKSAAKVSKIRNFDAFTLPIGASQAFANTWGAPRSGGRRHKGTDVMAACGAPVVAVANGAISSLRSGGLGGIALFMRANNGDVFYYAHLRGYAPGIQTGTTVSAGQKIATNGNSGNARGGPCHVHFEWRKDGGAPVSSYPLLASAR